MSWSIGGRAMGSWESGRVIACLFLCAALCRASDGPTLSASDVVNAADHSGGGVAPGEIVVLCRGSRAAAVVAGAQRDSDGRTATLLGETRVWFDGMAAPMVYSVTGQVGAVVPYAVAGRKTTQVVVEYQGVRSAAVELAVAPSAPALFTLDSSGKGQAGMLNERGCCNSARNPAVAGQHRGTLCDGRGAEHAAGDRWERGRVRPHCGIPRAGASGARHGWRSPSRDPVCGRGAACGGGPAASELSRSRRCADGRRGPAGADGGRGAESGWGDDGGEIGGAARAGGRARRQGPRM